MKYQAPFGSLDPDAPYVDRNTPGATRGSVPPAKAIEHPQREQDNLIRAAGITPTADDLSQVTRAVRSGRLNYAAAGGTATALTASLSVPLLAHSAGMGLRLLVSTAATGATTLTVDGVAGAIQRPGGGAIQSGDWSAGQILDLIDTGTAWQLVAMPASAGVLANSAVWTVAGIYSWVPPLGVTRVKARPAGAGGGGGACGSSGGASGGCGGGSGEGVYTVVPGTSYPVVIGAGGVGGTSAGNGGNGGTTSFGSFISATGGGGGGGIASGYSTYLGTPGSCTGGRINFTGGLGSAALTEYTGSLIRFVGGTGGACIGWAPSTQYARQQAWAPSGPGGGGSAGGSSQSTAENGFAGADGCLALEW
ncbi:hypothetical protein FHS55_002108 [Angulomicrobium tetraedrale]|uniref:Glycine-rich domain-containing protein n=1 Tax=Ancylobacter tetraedralis TaxID=217068 RepID=A0A839Z9V2_9HYPH|nr:hypothetical protein [Ancylobacter tetraedralis]MBB3771509.1 hypothetical protein [Ancylobacter tetraedralis]